VLASFLAIGATDHDSLYTHNSTTTTSTSTQTTRAYITTLFSSDKLQNMADFGSLFEVKKGDLQTNGIFKRGKLDLRGQNPLIVLIHGTGTNAAYFDNPFHS
jgi:hexokinase